MLAIVDCWAGRSTAAALPIVNLRRSLAYDRLGIVVARVKMGGRYERFFVRHTPGVVRVHRRKAWLKALSSE